MVEKFQQEQDDVSSEDTIQDQSMISTNSTKSKKQFSINVVNARHELPLLNEIIT